MQLGPFALMRSRNRARLLEDSELLKWYSIGGFTHFRMHAHLAPWELLEPDAGEASEIAAQRVTAAYRRAVSEKSNPSPSMWDAIEAQQETRAFVAALSSGDVHAVRHTLSRLFRTSVPAGLGRFNKSLAEGDAAPIDMYRRWLTEVLVCLAEATATKRVVNVSQQGVEAYRHALEVDADALFAEVEKKVGFDLSFPSVGGAYGCRVAGKLVTVDSFVQGYTAFLLRRLGATPASKVIEIGGGVGYLSLLIARAGFTDYEIFDLPWVNALQGYLLIMGLPEVKIRLYGEDEGDIKVSPHWEFARLADASVDFALNTDSLPEMGRETALAYVRGLGRVLRGRFLSINQEGCVASPGVGAQNWVAELVSESGVLRPLSRQLWWMGQGYVEEVFEPAR